jgi:hypothetical protein
MDSQSDEEGLNVMINPDCYISPGKADIVNRLTTDKHKTNKDERRRINDQRQRNRDRQKYTILAESSKSATSSRRHNTSVRVRNSNKVSYSDEESDISDISQPADFPGKKEQSSGQLSVSQLEAIRQIVKESVVAALEVKRENEAMPIDYANYLEDDVDYRLRGIQKNGGQFSKSFDIENADINRKQFEHYRLLDSLQEDQAAHNCNTFIEIGADLIEGLGGAIGLRSFQTKQLSSQMELAIKAGRFNSCVKQYASMGGGGQVMSNPFTNFMVTFASVAIKNHLQQKKSNLATQEPQPSNPILTPAPSYVQSRPVTSPSLHKTGPPTKTPPEPHNQQINTTPPTDQSTRPTTQSTDINRIGTHPSSRTKITEKPQFVLPVESISHSLSQFTPVIKHVQASMNTSNQHQQELQALQSTEPRPDELF